MKLRVQGASEHNLQQLNAEFDDGFTLVAGLSGSGKSSLVFDTIYHETHRRFIEIYSRGATSERLAPARVSVISGLCPAVAVGQNLLNRNPASTLATASGLHPLLRLLYANFAQRCCPDCGAELAVFTEDEIVEKLVRLAASGPLLVIAPLVRGVIGSHRALIELLAAEFGADALRVDGGRGATSVGDPAQPHTIEVVLGELGGSLHAVEEPRRLVQIGEALGATVLLAEADGQRYLFSHAPVCAECGAWFDELRPVHFHTRCPDCKGDGCERCARTGLHPLAAGVRWQGLRLPDLLARSVDEVERLFEQTVLPTVAARLRLEIVRRINALIRMGLGYLELNRSTPTLSRGEAQRVRLAVGLTCALEDILHVLDEPTIGQHPADISRLVAAFRDLPGPVICVEHDRVVAAEADRALEIGPGAGHQGGQLVFQGTPTQLWQADTVTGRYFSLRSHVRAPETRPASERYLTVRGAQRRNLKRIDVSIPLSRLSVITGVSGSGKSTLVEEVLVPSFTKGLPIGCESVDCGGLSIKPVFVDQSPIGRNPRSNPATYTKLSDTIRDYFAAQTGLSAAHFSFNRPDGACPQCGGMGAIEMKMRFLPAEWIPCDSCEGRRFSRSVVEKRARFGDQMLSIVELYALSIGEAKALLSCTATLAPQKRRAALSILQALCDVGLAYLSLGQPSPTLSGGEAQRVKLAKYLAQTSLTRTMLVMDEPSTGLHPQDLNDLLGALDRLVRGGATVTVVEHNLDLIRAADWIIDLGPGAGSEGGQLVYAGPPTGLESVAESRTGRALRDELSLQPRESRPEREAAVSRRTAWISIRNARAHNLKGVDVQIPKAALTVVTGVSGSGKSTLVSDVLEAEARRRFLESLSMYERQSTREGPQAQFDSVSGLGVAVTIAPERFLYNQRSTVGVVTEITHNLAGVFAAVGVRHCVACETSMARSSESGQWRCERCGASAPIVLPETYFSSFNYAAACPMCNGVGTLVAPAPEKLVIHPELPLCNGALYSPGFFPKGYLCKPYNQGYYLVQALAARYGFDPTTTPWKEMSAEAQHAFLFGDPEPLQYQYQSRSGRTGTAEQAFRGFYGLLGDWDLGGTYTNARVCPECRGARLRPEYLAVRVHGHNIYELSELALGSLLDTVQRMQIPDERQISASLETIRRRLRFLIRVGLDYLHLNRVAATLSAGEAQRIRLAGLLGSGLGELTVLLDEPSRGMHPVEIGALLEALYELRDLGNTVVVVEHDPLFMRSADYIIDMGPDAGTAGGQVVAAGTPAQVAQAETITGSWLRGDRRPAAPSRRNQPRGWLIISGARANNLRGQEVKLPLGVLTGVCGVSGSGKSTLLIDTLGRALVPHTHTTSVAREPMDPGSHDSIAGAPARAILLDQTRSGIQTPVGFLDLEKPLLRLYAQSADAQALGLNERALGQRCSACDRGATRIDMGFLPDLFVPCEICRGTGYRAEAWQVRLHDIALPAIFGRTLSEVYDLFADEPSVARPLAAALSVGLGYLVLRQPGYALSGGEAQRLKIARELCRGSDQETLYILDEPTVGQHLQDVARLVEVLRQLVNAGHSVIAVEHHMHLLAACDWLIELGPGGGPRGGRVIAAGPPEQIAATETPSAPYLRELLRGNP